MIQRKYAGKAVAIVDGKFVAFGSDSLDVEEKAVAKGYDREEVMTTYILGDKVYVL